MKVSNKVVYNNLDKLRKEATHLELSGRSKWVIMSDLHMGDGGSTDDFKRNSGLFYSTLKEYYFENGYSLLLNGDVEELQRFSMNKIYSHWKHVYELFDEFHVHDRLIRTIGNHDLQLAVIKDLPFDHPILEAVNFKYKSEDIFVFHGHQASKKYQKHNELVGFTLKYIANPLGFKNYSVSHSSQKQYNIEKRVYHYSNDRKLVTIIGHTHRPLFESLHKVERLKYKIEQLCRDFEVSEDKKGITKLIKAYKSELMGYHNKNKNHNFQSYVYSTVFHVPCVFNSGTVIGKRGMTCIEIEDGAISLVHWFDKKISKKFLRTTGYEPQQLLDSNYHRMVINTDTLDYIFTRINFLA